MAVISQVICPVCFPSCGGLGHLRRGKHTKMAERNNSCRGKALLICSPLVPAAMCQWIVSWWRAGNAAAFAEMQGLPITYILFLLHLIAEAKISTNMFYVAEKWFLIFLLPLAGFSSLLCRAGMLWVAGFGCFSLGLSCWPLLVLQWAWPMFGCPRVGVWHCCRYWAFQSLPLTSARNSHLCCCLSQHLLLKPVFSTQVFFEQCGK